MAASEWSERTRLITTIAVGVALNVLLCGWFYYVREDWKKLEKENKTLSIKKAGLTKEVEELSARTAELANLKYDLGSKERKLPEADQVDQLIEDVAAIAAKTGCKNISQVVVRDGISESTSYIKSIWKTRWEADFFSWCKLLNAMEENSERFVSFENMTLSPKNSGMVQTGSKHEISVDVVTYRYVRNP